MATFDKEVVVKAILETITGSIDAFKEDLKADFETHLKAIAEDTATVALAAAESPTREVAEVDLAHLSAQVQLISTIIAIREEARIRATIKDVALTSAKVLAKVLVATLIA